MCDAPLCGERSALRHEAVSMPVMNPHVMAFSWSRVPDRILRPKIVEIPSPSRDSLRPKTASLCAPHPMRFVAVKNLSVVHHLLPSNLLATGSSRPIGNPIYNCFYAFLPFLFFPISLPLFIPHVCSHSTTHSNTSKYSCETQLTGVWHVESLIFWAHLSVIDRTAIPRRTRSAKIC